MRSTIRARSGFEEEVGRPPLKSGPHGFGAGPHPPAPELDLPPAPRRPTVPAPARLLLAALLAALATSVPASSTRAQGPPPLPADRDPLVQDIDHSVRPGDDFFRYANGRWLEENPIPPTERGWGIGRVVSEEVYHQLREICQASARSGASEGSGQQKVGDYWVAGMDSVAIEEQGLTPLQEELDRIESMETREDLIGLIALFHTCGVRPLFRMAVYQDERNSEKYMIHLDQGGIRLPDRDYYFLDDPTTTRIRAQYLGHIAAMFRLLGREDEEARRCAQTVVDIETNLARASRTMEQLRDPYANYNKMPLSGLQELAPALDWDRLFASMGAPAADTVIVGQPEFFTQVDSSLSAVPLEDWRTYLRWNLLTTFADRLSSPFETEDFRFYGTVMNGIREQRPRWKRVLDAEGRSIGELLGQVWVKEHCSPEVKARYERLVDDIFAAYHERILRLPWMSEPTKAQALEKLARVNRKVAYPEHWRDYSALTVDRGSYAQNQIRCNRWWFHHRISKLGQPVDRTEWDMTPQTYNAYYDESNVEIVLPAAVFMIPGLSDSEVDDALLYSYAGASTIGHEITHGFDDEGRQFDANGNMHPWWTPEDSVRFTARAQKLVAQFDAYKVGERHVRGFATLGENIADLGGVVLGLEAFKKRDQWKEGREINGLTPDQRFFLGYALSWMGELRPEALDQQIMSDEHAPQFLRVNGPLSNLPEFYDAFDVRPGDPMWRPDSARVEIW